jgi:outer membrane protein TolC
MGPFMKKRILLLSLPVYNALFIFILLSILWALACKTAYGAPEMTTFRYTPQDSDQQVLELPLPIENGVFATEDSPDIQDSAAPLNLNLQDVVRYTVQNNKEIQYLSYNPPQAAEDLAIANSVYDLSIFESGSYNSMERPIENIVEEGPVEGVLLEDRWNLQIGVKKPIPTGGIVSLFMDSNDLDSSSSFVTPNPQNSSRLTAQIRQSLLKEFGDRTNKATIEIAGINIEKSREEFRGQVTSVLENVAQTYWQLFYDIGYEEIRRESLAMAAEVYHWEKTRLEQGIANPLDVNQAEAAVGSRKIALEQAENQINASRKNLHQVMGFPFAYNSNPTPDIIPTETARTEIIEVSEKETLAKAYESRPEIIAARKASEAAETKRRLAKHKLLPQLDAKASYTLNSLDKTYNKSVDELFWSDKDTWVVALEFEYPLGNNRAGAEYRKSILEHKQALKDVARTAEMIRLEVALAIKDVFFFGHKVRSTSEVQQILEQLVEGKKTRFEISQIDNDELLYAQNLLTEAKIEKLKAIITYNLKLLELSKVQGTLLEDLGISLQ